jgi:hypothetical protein
MPAAAPALPAPAASLPSSLPASLPASLPSSLPAAAPAVPAVPAPREAYAMPPPDYGPRWALSWNPLAVRAAALSLQIERLVRAPRFSAVAGVALRAGGGRDYRWLGVTLAVEGRYWFLARGPVRHARDGGMVGPYVALRVEGGGGRLRDRPDHEVAAAAVTFSELALLGYRLSLWGRAEVTPSVGFGLRHEVDPSGRLASFTTWAFAYGLTLGWMFGRPAGEAAR